MNIINEELIAVHHPEAVDRVKKNAMADSVYDDMSLLFKMLSDPTRLKIFHALFDGELCVADLTGVLNMTQSAVSHQLSMLKSARLLKSEKRGKHVYYRFNDEHVESIFRKAMDHVKE